MKSIDQDLWHVISNGDFKLTKTSFENQDDYLKFDKNTKAKIMIYKVLPRIEYERVYFCQTANDIWKNILNFHHEKCQVKDDQFDFTHELVILEKLMDRHLVEINTSTTSLNVFNEGISDEENMCQAQRRLLYESWSDLDEDFYIYPVCVGQFAKPTSKVHFKTKHFCFDTFILEFSKLENESKLLCNMDLKFIFNNEPSKFLVNNFEKEIMLEDKMSRLESNVEINLECKLCLDYKHEIKMQNEKGKIIS